VIQIPFIISTGSGINPYLPLYNIEKILENKLGNSFDYYITRKKGDLEQYVLEIIEKEKNSIMVGAVGDSGLDEMLNVILNNNCPAQEILIIVPIGTVNNFAKGNLNVKNVSSICEILRNMQQDKMNEYGLPQELLPLETDVMKITLNENKIVYGASSMSLGIIAETCNQVEKKAEIKIRKKSFRVPKKLSYAKKFLEIYDNYIPIEAEIDYQTIEGEKERVHLENLMSVTLTNGTYFASMKNWNPKGCCYDGKIELVNFEMMKLAKVIDLVEKIMFTLNDNHIKPSKDKNSYNDDRINYIDNLKSFEIKIRGKDKKSYASIEVGGRSFKLENQDAPIRVEVVPRAVRFAYMRRPRKDSETITNWR